MIDEYFNLVCYVLSSAEFGLGLIMSSAKLLGLAWLNLAKTLPQYYGYELIQ